MPSSILEARERTNEGSEPPPKPKTQQIPAHERRARSGRQVLPEHLPRVEIEVVPDEVQREGLDAYERIGEQVSEVLERRPASMVVVRIVRPKFVRKDRERNAETKVLTALPSRDRPTAAVGREPGPVDLADAVLQRDASLRVVIAAIGPQRNEAVGDRDDLHGPPGIPRQPRGPKRPDPKV